MDNLPALISMAAGIGVGTIGLVQSRKQPARARPLRGMSIGFFGIAMAMAIVFLL